MTSFSKKIYENRVKYILWFLFIIYQHIRVIKNQGSLSFLHILIDFTKL